MPSTDDPTARELGDQYEQIDEERRNSAALKIQRCYKIRQRRKFLSTYGDLLQVDDWHNFALTSAFLRQFIFYFDANQEGDIDVLCQICDKLLHYAGDRNGSNEILGVLADHSEHSKDSVVLSRVKKLALICVHGAHRKRYEWDTGLAFVKALRILAWMIDPDFWWNCEVVGYLQENKIYILFREIICALPENALEHHDGASPFEHVLLLLASHVGSNLCNCPTVDPRWSFSTQILSVPLVWDRLPHFKALYGNKLKKYYINQMWSSRVDILPEDISVNYPGYACLLANVLEVEASDTVCFYLQILGAGGDNALQTEVINEFDVDLQIQINEIIKHLVNAAFNGKSGSVCSDAPGEPSNVDIQAVASVCAFLHAITNTFQLDAVRTVLVHHTNIVSSLWTSIKLCYENKCWDSFSKCIPSGPSDALGWLLPLNIFCPLFKCALEVIIDDSVQIENFTFKDLKLLVLILKEALWELLSTIPQEAKTTPNNCGLKKMQADVIKANTRSGLCDLLTQLQLFSNRHQHLVDDDRPQILVDDDFCTQQEISPEFVHQAMIPGSREASIIKLAPFLVPYDIRFQIFDLKLATSKQTETHTRLRIRRSELFQDAFDQLNSLSEKDLHGTMSVEFIDDHGLAEQGVDGGGLRREFVNNIVEISFGQKLDLFKALYEKIPVGVRLAKFFLRQLKHKPTTFNDIASLDKDTYTGLLKLKLHIDNLDMSFEIENGDTVEKLIPGDNELTVTSDNVILYLNLFANHRLEQEIQNQTSRFLRGFEKVVPKEWISMFTESELQMLMSGPAKWDIDDLRNNTYYGGDYKADDDVIKMFWEILEKFNEDQQKKFLKFVTGSSHISIHGFQSLDPKFGIVRLGVGEGIDKYHPESSTCANLLKLPAYSTKEGMEKKLLEAISFNVGFHNE
ncbi:hypothetical protein ACQ4PT_004363 [Festuca glaucescens]